MSKNHESLYKKAKEAAKELFEDDSVSVDQTLASLEELKSEIEVMIDAVSYDV